LPKKINTSSDHNPVLFCDAVKSLEASSIYVDDNRCLISV
jgi:hypothetical protein